MDDLRDKVAVITGAASGIGLALAREAARQGMRVVLADVDERGVDRAASQLQRSGAQATPVVTDVGDRDSVETLGRLCYDTFGAVHLLCNNAGITTAADNVEYAWNVPRGDWERILRVNLWGVINGCLAFIPRMLDKGEEGHVLNTASSAGLTMGGPRGVTAYAISKHAVVRLSEGLAKQMADVGSRIRVSVLCPSYVATRIAESAFAGWVPADDTGRSRAADLLGKIDSGSDPAQIAERVFAALRRGWVHVMPHEAVGTGLKDRVQTIIAELEEQHR